MATDRHGSEIGPGRGATALPRLYAITDRALAGGLPHDVITRALIAGGARWIQLREKTLPPRDFLRQAQEAVAVAIHAGGGGESPERAEAVAGARPWTSGERALIVVNDRADIALAARADGLHVGREDLPAEEARRLLGPDALLGVSTHSVEEGRAASHGPVDYVAIGPVFPTSTKSDAEPVVGLEAVSALASSISLPVVAIGGIGVANARHVLEAGAHAVAVISALYDRNWRIEENVERLLNALRE